MNKNNLKKRIESNILKKIMKKCNFVGFFCMQNMSVIDKINLKKTLKNEGFEYILIKNTAIFKSFCSFMPKMKGVISGSLAICYNTEEKFNNISLISLKEIFSTVKKEKSIFFLGGIYQNSLVNSLLEVKLFDLKNLESVNAEYIFLIQDILIDFTKIILKSKNQFPIFLSKK
jgi:ribosomal protein L10